VIVEMEMWQFLTVIVLIVVAVVLSAWDDVRKNRIIKAQADVIKDQRKRLVAYQYAEWLRKGAEDGAAR